jgi:hypothetical protein
VKKWLTGFPCTSRKDEQTQTPEMSKPTKDTMQPYAPDVLKTILECNNPADHFPPKLLSENTSL